MQLILSTVIVLLSGCDDTSTPVAGADESGTGDTGNDTDSGNDSDSGGDTDTVDTEARATLDGEMSWSVDFGTDSEAEGATDCTYTRHYTGVEDRSAPWLCPDCDLTFLADVEMVAGLADCYAQVSISSPLESEYLGFGGGVWYRGAGSWLTEFGEVTVAGASVTVSHSFTAEELGADYSFEIAGSLTVATDDGDPYGGFVPPDSYACGWPKSDPAAYAGGYVAAVGETLPDGVFTDSCAEPVRLHDFAGEYLIVDISAMDCPPCQTAAESEEAFVEEMAAAGIPVHVITLLAPSLSDTAGTPTQRQLRQWIDGFDLTSPVLADRVWGLSVVGQQLGDDFGYPTFVVVSPDLDVLEISTGFSSFDEMGATITADAGQ